MKRLLYSSLSLVCLLGTMSLLSGCAASMSIPDTVITEPTNGSVGLQGHAMGGQQPIIAGHVYMFEAHNTQCYGLCNPTSNPITYGTPATSLLGNSGGHSCTFPLVMDGNGFCYYQTVGAIPAGGPETPNLNPALGNGGFDLNNKYACTPGDQVWLLSLSGYTTTSGGVEALNPYAGLMASLGPCPLGGNFSNDSFIYMNELSTVAMAYAIAGFAGPTTQTHYGTSLVIATDATNVAGFNQAFAVANQLYNPLQNNAATNQFDQSAPHVTATGTGIPPYYLLNTVADMLAACINSTVAAAPTNCANLFSASYGSSHTTDTASVAIQIAQKPSAPGGIDELLALSDDTGPWFPNNTSSGAPYGGTFPDLTAAISYSIADGVSGNITPSGIALDGAGNVFTDAYATAGYMVKVSPLGVVLSSTSGDATAVDNSTALALDSTGLIWADGYTQGNVYEVNGASGLTSTSVTNFAFTPPATGPLKKAIDHPVAADKNGNVFFADGSVKEVYWISNGVVETGGIASTACTKAPNGVAVDGNATPELWVTNGHITTNGNYAVCHISIASSPTVYSEIGPSSMPYIDEADGVAVDSGNNGWIYDSNGNSVYEVAPTGSTFKGAFNGAGLDVPSGIAIDGLNNVFLQNAKNSQGYGGSISEFTSAGIAVSPATYGYQAASVDTPAGIAIDISGNVWIANYAGTDLLEVVGLAAPTAGPLYSGHPGTRP